MAGLWKPVLRRVPVNHDTAGHRAPDAAVLGRSPSRSGFTSANHLLNFQYESRQVQRAPHSPCLC